MDQTPEKIVPAEWEPRPLKLPDPSSVKAMRSAVIFVAIVTFSEVARKGFHWLDLWTMVSELLIMLPVAYWFQKRAIRDFETLYRPTDPDNRSEVGMVRISLGYNDRKYGGDMGFLTVDGTFIHFEGLRTTFSLDGRDLAMNGAVYQLRWRPAFTIRFNEWPDVPGLTTPGQVAIDLAVDAAVKSDEPFDSEPRIIALPPLVPIARDVQLWRLQRFAANLTIVALAAAILIDARELLAQNRLIPFAVGVVAIVVAAHYARWKSELIRLAQSQ